MIKDTPKSTQTINNHLCTQAVLMLKERRCRFRLLGLSATPGGKREAIQVPAWL